MKPKFIVRCADWNHFRLQIKNREILHLRQTISTGKLQFFQLPFCNTRYGIKIYSDYALPQIEDGNERTQLIIKDVVTYPHHYDEGDDEPDYDEQEMMFDPEPIPPTTFTHATLTGGLGDELVDYTTWITT